MKGSEEDEEERGDEKRESVRRILMTARTQTHAYQNIIHGSGSLSVCACCRFKCAQSHRSKHTLRRQSECVGEQSVLLDVVHFVPEHSIVLPLLLGLRQSSSSYCCSSLLSTPPLTLSLCPPVMSTHISLTQPTAQSHAHTPFCLHRTQSRP